MPQRYGFSEEMIQRRNINLVLRGCVVLSYDYFGYGDSKTGDQAGPVGANGHRIRLPAIATVDVRLDFATCAKAARPAVAAVVEFAISAKPR